MRTALKSAMNDLRIDVWDRRRKELENLTDRKDRGDGDNR